MMTLVKLTKVNVPQEIDVEIHMQCGKAGSIEAVSNIVMPSTPDSLQMSGPNTWQYLLIIKINDHCWQV